MTNSQMRPRYTIFKLTLGSFGSPVPVTTGYSVEAATTGVFAPTKIYYIAGQAQIYDLETSNWSIGATVPTARVSNER